MTKIVKKKEIISSEATKARALLVFGMTSPKPAVVKLVILKYKNVTKSSNKSGLAGNPLKAFALIWYKQ